MATATQPQTISAKTTSGLEVVFNSVRPLILSLLNAADAAGPYIAQGFTGAQRAWAAVQPYHPDDWLPIVFGLVLIFFGGQFPVLLAAVEAFRLCGWDGTKRAVMLLWDQCQVALQASRKDDLLDENNDGIADIKQIDGKQLVSRKVNVFLKSTDPRVLNEGLQGLAAGCSAVIATLRVHFAQTLTLGVSLGDIFTRTADTVARPALEHVLPREHHKWIGLGISYTCRSVAVTIAWWCTRIISAMHSATRGAQMLLLGVTKVARRYNVQLPVDLSNVTPVYPVVCGALAGMGLYSQIARGFSLPFPLNIILLPLKMVEWIMYWVLAYGGAPATV